MTTVLVVEDQEDLAFGLRTALENEGYHVRLAGDGTTGLTIATDESPDLVILDLMLPRMDGYRVLRELRASGSEIPVLILTARGEESSKVQAFGIGGDDYVTKPFGVLELLARIRSLLRRSRRGVAPIPSVERFADIEINPASRTVYRAGQAVALAPREFDLLLALVGRRGAVASRTDLLREVWGYRHGVVTRTIDIHIAELRRKLEEDPARPRHICTVRKVGYRLER